MSSQDIFLNEEGIRAAVDEIIDTPPLNTLAASDDSDADTEIIERESSPSLMERFSIEDQPQVNVEVITQEEGKAEKSVQSMGGDETGRMLEHLLMCCLKYRLRYLEMLLFINSFYYITR